MLHRRQPSWIALLALAGCQPGLIGDGEDQEAELDHAAEREVFEGAALAAAIDSQSPIRAPAEFRRIGASWTGEGAVDLEISTSVDGTEWSRWQRFQTHHSELEARAVHSGDVWSASEEPARYYRLRRDAAAAPPDRLVLDFFIRTTADDIESGDRLMPFASNVGTQMIRFGAAEVLPRTAWNAKPARCSSGHTPRRITLHHTEQPNDSPLSAPALIRSVQGYHQNTRGWCDVGYHFLISRDGQIWQGRPIENVGSHTKNNNTGNIGIALIGNFVAEAPTTAQQNAAAALIRGVALEYDIPLDRNHLSGHREMRATECPGEVAYNMLDDLLAMAAGDLEDLPAPPRPDTVRVIGAIYRDGDMGDRIGTAEVTVNGEAVAVDEFGVYEIRVPASTAVTIAVTAPGFEPETIERQAVTDPTWASVGIAETGSVGGSAGLQGVVYTGGDPLNRIGNAVIEIEGGRTAVATPDGYWRIGNLAPGTYTVTASATGFTTESTTASAQSGTFGWASVELSEGAGPTSTSGPSCERICGSNEPLFDGRRCYCDSLCIKNDDCCDSYYTQCR